jgi:hypothetical protein
MALEMEESAPTGRKIFKLLHYVATLACLRIEFLDEPMGARHYGEEQTG